MRSSRLVFQVVVVHAQSQSRRGAQRCPAVLGQLQGGIVQVVVGSTPRRGRKTFFVFGIRKGNIELVVLFFLVGIGIGIVSGGFRESTLIEKRSGPTCLHGREYKSEKKEE